MLEFIEFPAFTTPNGLAKERADDVLLEIQNDLLENPKHGHVIEGLMVFNKNEQDNLTKKQKMTRGQDEKKW